MVKTIKGELSGGGIQGIINELKKFKQEFCTTKVEEFVKELADIGVPVIKNKVNSTVGKEPDLNVATSVRVETNGDTITAILEASGKDLLFIEFGAGVYYNGSVGSSPHPGPMVNGQEVGDFPYKIGEYGYGNGAYESWMYQSPVDGHWDISSGTKASMPVYSANVEICNQIVATAKKVFGS